MNTNEAKKEILKAAKDLVALDLVARTWGNISCRIDDSRMVITPSGIAYDKLTEDHIVVVDISTGKAEGSIKASSEKGIHMLAYGLDNKINFLIHTHQIYASSISVVGVEDLKPTAEEKDILGGDILKASYGLPGTKKLQGYVEEAIRKGSKAILMERHGTMILGGDREETFKRAVALETICKAASINIEFSKEVCQASSRRVADIPAYHKMFYDKYLEFNNIKVINSPAIMRVMEEAQRLEPMVDDFAQMVGIDMKVVHSIEEAVRAIKKRNGVFLRGVGAICCGATEDDCLALVTLIEKNSIIYLNAGERGVREGLSAFDKRLMRFVYKKKYSKRNK